MIEVLTVIVILVVSFFIGGLLPFLIASLIIGAVDLCDMILAAWIRRRSLREHYPTRKP